MMNSGTTSVRYQNMRARVLAKMLLHCGQRSGGNSVTKGAVSPGINAAARRPTMSTCRPVMTTTPISTHPDTEAEIASSTASCAEHGTPSASSKAPESSAAPPGR